MGCWIKDRNRRTHGVYRSEDEAIEAAHNLLRLLNGHPVGFVVGIQGKMNAFAVVSYKP